jgi:LacI family transcriptional regulator
MAVRMKDIARELGVSVVTVSKVLRNHEDISDETRQRVLKLMKELDYQPNLAARALVTGRTLTRTRNWSVRRSTRCWPAAWTR